jgi:uncharacterized protein YlaN (UPF0358 family)
MINIPTQKLLMLCEKDAERLKLLRKIQNEILVNCAYHDKNREKQLATLRSSGATKEEIKMVISFYDLQEKYGKRLMHRFERLRERLEHEAAELEIE